MRSRFLIVSLVAFAPALAQAQTAQPRPSRQVVLVGELAQNLAYEMGRGDELQARIDLLKAQVAGLEATIVKQRDEIAKLSKAETDPAPADAATKP